MERHRPIKQPLQMGDLTFLTIIQTRQPTRLSEYKLEIYLESIPLSFFFSLLHISHKNNSCFFTLTYACTESEFFKAKHLPLGIQLKFKCLILLSNTNIKCSSSQRSKAVHEIRRVEQAPAHLPTLSPRDGLKFTRKPSDVKVF